MEFELKAVAFAVATLGCISASAAALNPVTDTPDVVFYIAGSSAQRNAVANIMPSAVFAAPADVVQINGSVSTGPDLPGLTIKVSSQAWYGMSIPSLTGGTSKKLLVIYNNTNGSASGLRQLIDPTNFTTVEKLNISVPLDASCTATAGTIATPDGSLTMPNYVCNVLSPIGGADLALSDVSPTEFAVGIVPSGPNAITTKRTGLEGFGIVVNAATYAALQAQNVAEAPLFGCMPTSCLGDNAPGCCQSAIHFLDFAALMNQNNAPIVTSATLLPGAPAANLTLCRRTAYSGTQAASNIYFLDNVCGAKGYGGGQPVAGTADSTANFTIVENATTEAVERCVANASGYALGVVSLGEDEGASNSDGSRSYRFVKLDCASPNVDDRNRATMIRGYYDFAMDMTASYKKSLVSGSAAYKIANAIITDMTKIARSDLKGIGYEDPSGVYGDGKTARYTRGGNNCAPLH